MSRVWETMTLSVEADASTLRQIWLDLGVYANDPYSCYAWCESWYRAAKQCNGGQALIVVGRSESGRVEMLLPLFLEKRFGLTVVTRPARQISGDFGGIFTPELRASINADNASQFWKRVAKVIPGDVLAINGLSSDEIDRANPMGYLFRHQSQIDGFHTTLSGDWDQQYEQMFSSKIRRNDRRCSRRLQEEGQVAYEVVGSPEKQDRALTALIGQKIEQLEEAGQPHHYHDPTVSAFFHNLPQLMHDSLDEEFLLIAMKFDGEVIATNFGVRKGNRHYGLMTAMSNSMRKFSPGRLVMLETSRILTGRGCRFYDFGNGDYQYKQYWCTGKRHRYTALAALSWKGALALPMIRFGLAQKRKAQERRAMKVAQGKDVPPVNKSGG